MTVLIGLTGLKGSGKDTAFQFAHEWAAERGFYAGRRGFADTLKHSFARLFIPDISRDEAIAWCDRLKESGSLTVEDATVYDGNQLTTLTHKIPCRTGFQRYGTESHRDVFGEDFWVDQLLPVTYNEHGSITDDYAYGFLGTLFGMEQRLKPNLCFITDLRFENEARRIKELGGEIWEIFRPDQDRDQHISESGLPPEMIDLVIRNDATLDRFRDNVFLSLTQRHEIYLQGEKND